MKDNKLYIELEDVKSHLNLDQTFKDDDVLLLTYLQMAQDVVSQNIDTPLVKLEDEQGDLPMGLIGAILLYVGMLYNSREAVTYGTANELPLGFKYILDNYRDYNPNKNS